MTDTYQPELTELGHDIVCIDADYIRPGLACCYMIDHCGEVAIIETGTGFSAAGILTVLRDKGIAPEQVKYVIPTHVHLDHAGGAGVLMEALPDATAVVHPRGARHLIDPQKLIAGSIAVYGEQRFKELYGDVVPIPQSRVQVAEDGDSVDLAGRKLLFRDTPGHASHHFCIWDEYSRGWFSGDTFGLGYRELIFPKGRFLFPTTTPVQFDPDRLIASIDLLMSYQPARVYLTHYGLLKQPGEYAGLLREQIEAYRAIALGASNTCNRVEQLRDAIAVLTLARVREIDPELLWADLEILNMDMQLNAQGLEVWLQRQGPLISEAGV